MICYCLVVCPILKADSLIRNSQIFKLICLIILVRQENLNFIMLFVVRNLNIQLRALNEYETLVD